MPKVLLEPIWFRDNSTRRRAYIFCPACYEQSKKDYPDDSRFWINSALHCLIVAGEGAWEFNQDYDRPTFTPSLLMHGEVEICHSFIADGKIQYLMDCTHAMAGQTVELMDAQLYLEQYPDFGKQSGAE